MKKIFSLGLMLVALTLMNCSKEEIAAPANEGANFELFASAEDGRTVNDGWSTVWKTGDQINVFHAEAGSTTYSNDKNFTVQDEETGLFTGTLTGTLTAEAYDWYLLYPYSSYVTTPASTSSGFMTIGSASKAAQSQTGNNSTKHIAGENYPLYGKALNVAANEMPVVTMKHLTSLVEFEVKNTGNEPFKVTSIQFTSADYIVGTYYINFAGETVEFTGSGTSYVSKTATLNVTNGEEIAAGATAKFYMAVKPHEVKAGKLNIKVTTTVGVCDKTLENVTTTFTAGKIKTIGVNYEVPAAAAKAIPFEDTLDWLAPITKNENTELVATDLSENYISSTKIYKDGQSLKFGSSEVRGSLTTTRFELTEPFVVVVRAKNYSSDSSKIQIKVGDVTSTEQTLTGDYKFYAFAFDAQEAATTVTINITGKRGYIEYFAIQKAGYQLPAEIFVTSGDIAVDAAGATGTIAYTVQNPVEGQSVTATTDASWITIGEQTDGSIAYTIAANEDSEQRKATIMLSYNGAWKSAPVQVSQAGKPSEDVQTVTETIVFAEQWKSDTAVTSVTIKNIAFVFSKSSGTTAPKYYANGTAVRVYAKNTIKVSAPTGGTLTKIVMTQTDDKNTQTLTVNTGSYSKSSNVGTWMGEAASVTFTAPASGQHRVVKMEVTYTL